MDLDLGFYSRLFIRRLPVMAALVLVCSALGAAVALRMPPTYNASARLLVEAPQIPMDMANSMIESNAGEQLQVIEQRLMTRANLIDIANRHGVFADRTDMEPDAVVTAMRAATSIRLQSGRGQATLMTVGFQARTGRIAAAVVNDYTTRILETNSDSRRQRVEGTLEFFEQEVARLSEELDRQSSRIIAFKTENADALPEDQTYRLSRQTLLQERLSRLEQDRSTAIEQRRQVLAMFEATGRITRPNATRAPQASPEELRLETLKMELNEALTVYSESNPRIVGLQSRIDQLEEAVAAQETTRIAASGAAEGSDEEGAGTGEDGIAEAESPQSTEEALLQLTLGELDTRLASIDEQIATSSAELDRLARAIANSSTNAIALDGLQREYENIETRYNRAAANLNQAQIGERIEVTSQGERISVIEGASVPRVPSGPNRPAIAGLGVGIGLGLAGAFFVLLELLNRSIRRPAEITARFGITPIATIPYMESAGRRWLRRGSLIAATLVVLIGVPIGLWWVDTHYLPLQVIVERGLAKLGLG